MANNTYFDSVNGRRKQKAAITTSAGSGDANKIFALDGTGRIDNSFLPTGVGADTQPGTASEALADGAFVNIWNNSGVTSVRNADASVSGKEAVGFVLGAVSSGATATVYLEGTNTHLSSLTGGTRYYLSASTPGTATTTPPSGSGNVVQFLGVSTSTTALNFKPDEGDILA